VLKEENRLLKDYNKLLKKVKKWFLSGCGFKPTPRWNTTHSTPLSKSRSSELRKFLRKSGW
jgi:hypothetical protein